MSKLANKQCPRFKSACLIQECAWYDERLDNCAVEISNFNLYKLRISLDSFASGGHQVPAPNQVPAQPAYPDMR